MSLGDYADSNDGRGIIYALESLAEQQRIANLIALAQMADQRFGNYAGEAGGMGTLFSYGERPESNMRVRDDIAYALGIRGYQAPNEPVSGREDS